MLKVSHLTLKSNLIYRNLILVLLNLLMMGCGQGGPLYLPKKELSEISILKPDIAYLRYDKSSITY